MYRCELEYSLETIFFGRNLIFIDVSTSGAPYDIDHMALHFMSYV